MIWFLLFLYVVGAYTTMAFRELIHDGAAPKVRDCIMILLWPITMVLFAVLDLSDRIKRRKWIP